MKIKTFLALFVTAALSLNLACAAEEDTPLAKQMKTMNKSLRTLKRQVGDGSKKEENLELLATIKKTLAASAELEPTKTKDVPAGEKDAYLEKYKKELSELGKSFEEVEAALKKAFDKISEQKEKGHKDFGADDDK